MKKLSLRNSLQIFLKTGALALAAVFACSAPLQSPLAAEAATTAATLPGDSVYQLDVSLLDQDGRAVHFADGRGKPRLVSMFYTSCQFMCPLIIDTLRKTEHALGEQGRAPLDVLMVSFDADKDLPPVLKAMADKRHLDAPQWTLAHAATADVRRLAAVLGIQYRRLQDGEFSHSSVLLALDANGRIVARTEKMGMADADFVAAAAKLSTPK